MVRSMRRVFFLLIRALLIPTIIRELVQRKCVTILVYHNPSVETAREHFRALRRRYNIIPLRDYIRARLSGSLVGLPPKSMVITIDDGHATNYLLRGLLKDMGIPATVFLCSGLVGTNRHYWFKHDASGLDIQKMKKMPDHERLRALAEFGYTDEAEFEDRQALSAEEIEELKPWVDFQSHTVTHPILPRCSEGKAACEIAQSKADLESRFGLDIYAICYPNGDYSDRDIAACKDAGYTCGVASEPGFNCSSTDLFRLKRFGVNEQADINQLLVTACGVWPFLRIFIKGPGCGHTEAGRVSA